MTGVCVRATGVLVCDEADEVLIEMGAAEFDPFSLLSAFCFLQKRLIKRRKQADMIEEPNCVLNFSEPMSDSNHEI
jgi:hypothetical protein